MKPDKIESVSSLVSAMEIKKTEAEEKRGRLKDEMDQIMDEADALESQARAKRRDAKDLYEQIGALNYGNWVSDVIWPLADELAARTGKKAKILGPAGLGAKLTIALLDDPDRRRTDQDSLELTVEMDSSGPQTVLRYETGERTDCYEPGTVGFINGLNNITAPLPDSVEEILALFRMHPAVNLTKKTETDSCEKRGTRHV